MTLQKIKNIRQLILVSVSIVLVSIIVGFVIDSCGFRHIEIISGLKTYEKSMNPEICDALVEKINLFNLECSPEIEIMDCG